MTCHTTGCMIMASLRTPEQIDKFKAWLCERGAEILTPTNEYEVLRFRSIKGTSIVYRDKRGSNTMTNEAGVAYDAWSCMCNDECPVCGAEIEPYESEEIE